MKDNYTITVQTKIMEVIKEYYRPFFVESNGEYIDFQAKTNGVVITGYSSKKERKKISFKGENAFKEASIWDKELREEQEAKKTVKEEWMILDDQIGRDEVGVGDFLGPMIVVAAYVSKDDIKTLREYGIHDSKKMTDKKIKEIGPQIVKQFAFSKLTLPNHKYNELQLVGENLNSMKAKMHNRALLNLHKKYPHVTNIFIDQFIEEEKYYQYLNDENEEQVKGVVFKTKGESFFPCVALASVIARYSYLMEMELLSKKYKMTIPFGASKKVTLFAKNFVKKYGIQEFDKIAKKNFANYREVISE